MNLPRDPELEMLRLPGGLAHYFKTHRGRSDGSSWLNVGVFDLPTRAKTLAGSRVALSLYYLEPSSAILVAQVRPSTAYQTRYQTLLHSEGQSRVDLPLRALVWQSRTRSVQSADEARAYDLNSAALELNRELVRWLRRHVGTGLAMSGPLPGLEVFITTRDLPELMSGIEAAEPTEESRWLRHLLGLRETRYEPWFVADPRMMLWRSMHWSKHSRPTRMRVLLGTPADSVDSTAASRALNEHREFLEEVTCLLALEELFAACAERALRLADSLAPILRSQKDALLGAVTPLGRLSEVMALDYKQDLVWSELEGELDRGFRAARKEWEGGVLRGTIAAILGAAITRYRRTAAKQVKALKERYGEIVSHRNLRIASHIQWLFLLLTVATIFPDECKNQLNKLLSVVASAVEWFR